MAVPGVTSAAVTRVTTTAAVVATTQNPATPVTTTAAAAAATTSAATPAAVTTSAAAPAAETTTAAAAAVSSSDAGRQQPQAQTSSSSAAVAAAPVVVSSSSSAASSSSARPSSSSAAASSSSSAASSSSASRSSSSTSATGTVAIAGVTDASASSGNQGLTAGEIGGIVGGAAAGIIILVILFLCWRKKRRTRGERLPPPPPRDPTLGQTASMMRQRSSSGVLLGGPSAYRQSSQFGLLQSRPSVTSAGHSRTPSFYTTYPIATPSSGADISPPMEPQMVPLSDNSGTGLPADTPSSSEGSDPARSVSPDRPRLAIDTGLRRDDSSSSNETGAGAGPAPTARRIPSIDRLRSQAGIGSSSDRAPSPSGGFFPPSSGPSEPGSSRANSPHPSQRGSLNGGSGYPSPTPSTIGRFPRPLSMTSMSSHSKYLHIGPAGGAPHMGRPLQLKMPAPLGQDAQKEMMNPDFFPSMSTLESGQMAGYDSMRHMNRYSQGLYDSVPEMGGPSQRPISNSQSLGNYRSSRSFGSGTSPMPPPGPPAQHRSLNGYPAGPPRFSVGPRSPVDPRAPSSSQQHEEVGDRRSVLGREEV